MPAMNRRTNNLYWLGLLLLLPWITLSGCGGGGGGALVAGGGTGGEGGGNGAATGDGGAGSTVTRTISGTVLDGLGNPVPGATVSVVSTRTREIANRADTTLTGTDGSFSLIVTVTTSVKTVVLQITHPDLGTTQVDVDLSSGETMETVAILAHGGTPDPTNTPPSFTAVSATPGMIDFTGGQVTLSATVTDPDTTTLEVLALVSTSGTLSIVTLTGSGSIYTGTYNAPSNFGVGAQDKTFEVSFVATDAPSGSGKTVTAAQTASFTVKGYSAPPSLP